VVDRVLTRTEYTRINAEAIETTERVVREIGLAIYINKRHFTTAMIMPTMEKEFVTGYLFGQGFINSISEIESIAIENNTAEVSLP
jgi:FdhD protein